MRKLICIVFLLLVGLLSFAQSAQLDSLQLILTNSKEDTSKINTYLKIAALHGWNNTELMISNALKAKDLAKKIGDDNGLFESYFTLTQARYISGDFGKGLTEAKKALKIAQKVKNNEWEEQILNQIGLLYLQTGKYEEAIYYFESSIKLLKNTDNQSAYGTSYNNIANCYLLLNDYKKSMELREKAIEIREKLDDLSPLGDSYNDLGETYFKLKEYESAIYYLKKCLAIKENIVDLEMSALSSYNLGQVYLKMKELNLAKSYLEKSYGLSVQIGAKTYQLECLQLLAEVEQLKNNPANENYILHKILELRDSLYTEESQRQINDLHAEFGNEKKELQIELLKKDKEQQNIIANEKSRRVTIIIISFVIGIILLIIILMIGINRYKVTKAQKNLIEAQKEIVEEAHQEIKDSIAYAKRIQSAILPPNKLIKEYLKEYFILYKPKDVVAGDFYWVEHKDGKVLFAAADCTGHGVPGAMVSVVCNNALNRSVREHGLKIPGEILAMTRDIVIEEFEKSEEDVKDGMDVALCSLEGMKLQYAGAHNPLWIIRNGEIIETKANKQPIGKFDNPEPYTTHSFELEQGDSIYIFSDGYVDQFGGEKGKKFKAKAFRELLLSIQNKTMEEQKLVIDETFENWKGSLEQIDDVCVIGVRV
jgi:serine phosphatase RsbU (regulator of sigma subunit)